MSYSIERNFVSLLQEVELKTANDMRKEIEKLAKCNKRKMEEPDFSLMQFGKRDWKAMLAKSTCTTTTV